jgi:uncharacterized protein (DUF1697 family)
MAERYVAFLRAVNVGGRVVKMDRLRELFESVPLANVATFIASGNVAFESRTADTRSLETKIEKRLRAELGYDVETFVRSATELAQIADYQPFVDLESSHTLCVGFLADTPTSSAQKTVVDLRTEVDDFHIHGREIYWRCRTRISQTLVTGPKLARALGMPTTMRNITTVNRLVAKYPVKAK